MVLALDHAHLGLSAVIQNAWTYFSIFGASILWKTSKRTIRDGFEFNRRGLRLIGQEGTRRSR